MALNKIYPSFDKAVADVPDGATVLIGNFAGPGGTPFYLIHALRKQGAKNLTIVGNTAGGIGLTLDYDDHRILFENKQVKKVIASFPFSTSASRPSAAEKQILANEVELELVPQGTLAERIRCGAAGIPAFYTSTGYGTVIAEGKEVRWFEGIPYLMEQAIKADYALVRAYKADQRGNLIYRGTMRQFNPIMAMNAKITIAEVDEIVETGEIDPEAVATPGIFVNRIVKVTEDLGFPRHLEIAMRAAKELFDGAVVNLGIGIPTLVSSFVPEGMEVIYESENGMLGFGPVITADESAESADIDLVNAGGQYVTPLPGMCFFHHADSFLIIRGGHIDITMLGVIEVSQKGDLANWMQPGRGVGNIGGGMDLAFNAKKVIVLTEHTTKDGKPKIVKQCSVPLTAPECVDLIITDVAVIARDRDGLLLKETAPGWTPEDVQAITEAKLKVAPDVKELEL